MLLEYLAPPLSCVYGLVVFKRRPFWYRNYRCASDFVGCFIGRTERAPNQQPSLSISGILFGCGAAFCQATGLVMAFSVLQNDLIDPLSAAFIRLAAGSILLALIVGISQRHAFKPFFASAEPLTHCHCWVLSFFGMTFLAIWLQQLSIAHINPGLTQTLLSTAPLFLIPISLLKKQKITVRSLFGALVSLGGIAILFL